MSNIKIYNLKAIIEQQAALKENKKYCKVNFEELRRRTIENKKDIVNVNKKVKKLEQALVSSQRELAMLKEKIESENKALQKRLDRLEKLILDKK